MKDESVICIIGMGFVGLPLALSFSKFFKVIGFDINKNKIKNLKTNKNLILTSDSSKIKIADFVIITVPTPITKSKEPDLSYTISASKIVGKNLKKGAVVVLESTVYPGVTEEIVAPILEKESGLIVGKDFKIGYSPERINPGDKDHTLEKIIKIVSGMDKETTENLARLYGKITNIYVTNDIKTAEAAKVIENVQRDLNIALINEFAIIFHKMNLSIYDILDAASSKWNFIKFSPGLVGGHCIPVDPYYLVYKAKEIGYHPQVVLAGRSVNDYMPEYIVEITIKALNDSSRIIKGSKILLMGLTFKENVADIRETPVKKIIQELNEYKCDVYGFDPLLKLEEINKFGIKALDKLNGYKFDCIIILVAHDIFKKIEIDKFNKIITKNTIIIDIRREFRKISEKLDIIYRTL
jgi:UDPglucose 6-dehydrogenase/UDP-N-acetyl-D-galactosamine dehydrogenase